ncbi:MAG: hypothetical protein Q9217_005912 [Psora testacea]
MAKVQSVNVGLGLSDYATEATTPTTPRAPMPVHTQLTPTPPHQTSTESAPNTPTRMNFGGISGQRPLPTSPFRSSFSPPTRPDIRPNMARGHSQQSVPSHDVDMEESDGEGDAGSDVDSVDPETGRISKKKKGQRFFCTDFPPCKLSFTRSEHLARHIRYRTRPSTVKHTGERPFQCHCSRRFSRLDNLRQHAQTVHVNEEIPVDSLAATGTRFQRQIRTDRVPRPPGSRSRASTAGSQGSHHRGHGRNLSASSIGSTTASTVSRDDSRRRPPPLIMANDPNRTRLSLDVLRSQTSTPPGQTSFFRESSEGVSTPTSTTFSTGQNSPGYGSSLGSPVSGGARGSGFWDGRGHTRRLSVPSGPILLQSPQSNTYGSPYLSPLASSQASTFSNLTSSTSREAAEAEIRRRTWHPPSYTYTNYSRPGAPTSFSRPATSGLTYYQTPDAPHPAYATNATAATSQSQRLPGIETFDQAPRRPATPPPRGPSPMHIDPTIRPPVYPGPSVQSNSGPHDRRGHASWDMSLHQNLTKLDIASSTSPKDPASWNQQPRPSEHGLNDGPAPHHLHAAPIIHQDTSKRTAGEADYPLLNPNRMKRQGWYAGPPLNKQPVTSHPRTSPGDSTGSEGVPKTPSIPAVEHHPLIVHSNGYVESALPNTATGHSTTPADKSQPPAWPLPSNAPPQQYNQSKDTEMSGLDVLVAAATREENAASRA